MIQGFIVKAYTCFQLESSYYTEDIVTWKQVDECIKKSSCLKLLPFLPVLFIQCCSCDSDRISVVQFCDSCRGVVHNMEAIKMTFLTCHLVLNVRVRKQKQKKIFKKRYFFSMRRCLMFPQILRTITLQTVYVILIDRVYPILMKGEENKGVLKILWLRL